MCFLFDRVCRRILVAPFAFLAFSLVTAGCGPVRYGINRWAWAPYKANEYVQSQEGVILELHETNDIPPMLYGNVQACNNLTPVVNSDGTPTMERILLAPGCLVQEATITNNTSHVIRLNRSVIKAFDPAGTQSDAMGYEDLQANLLTSRPCATTNAVIPQLRLVKLVGRSVEIVPGTNFRGFMVFKPPARMTGVWKIALYDVPVKTNEAGDVTKTTKFEIRSVAKHFVDYYIRDTVFASPRLERTEEVP